MSIISKTGSLEAEGSNITATMVRVQGYVTVLIVLTCSSLRILAASINNGSVTPTQVSSTPTVPTTAPAPLIGDIVPKSVLTFIGLTIFIIIGLGIAKVVDRFHDSVALRDDSSDISEHTRDLLKARFALFAFSPARIQSEANQKQRDIDRARKFGRLWMARAAMSRRKKREDEHDMPTVAVENETGGGSGDGERRRASTSGAQDSANSDAPPPIPGSTMAATTTSTSTTTTTTTTTATVPPVSTAPPSTTAANPSPTLPPKVTLVSYQRQHKDSTTDENKKGDPGGSNNISGKTKRNNDFIAIDIQNLDDSTATTKEGSTIPSTPRKSYIEFLDMGEDVTIPVRVVQQETPGSSALARLNFSEYLPPKPKLAYTESVSSDFGSDLSFKQSKSSVPPVTAPSSGKSHAAEGLEITSLSRENSFESVKKQANGVKFTTRARTARTPASKTVAQQQQKSKATSSPAKSSRPITPGAGLRDSRPMSSRVTTSRPLTAGRAQPITQGAAGVRGMRLKSGYAAAARRGR